MVKPIAFSTSVAVRVFRKRIPLNCVLRQHNLDPSPACGSFVTIQIRVPQTCTNYCSEKHSSPSVYKHVSPISRKLQLCPLCTQMSPDDDDDDDGSFKDGQPNAMGATDKPFPKISFWTAVAAEVGIGILGITLCTAMDISILGPNFVLSLDVFLHACQTAMIFFISFWLVDQLPIGIGKEVDAQYRAYFENRNLFDVTIFCMCVAFGEELLFRAWLLNTFCNIGLSKTLALTTSAIIFGVLHAQNVIYITLASLGGALFGLMLLSTGSIFEPLLVHFIYDFGVIVLLQQQWRSHDEEEAKQ